MSEWQPQVIKLEKIERHPNADTLEISTVLGGYTVIFKEGRFHEGDLAAYIPSDSICSDHSEFDWLGDKKRIKPVKLRGVFSLGILASPPPDAKEGDPVIDFYNLKKHIYEEEMPDLPGRQNGSHLQSPIGWSIPYYDLSALRQLSWMLNEGEEVIITEKIEGCNAAFGYAPDAPDGDPLWVKSRNFYLKEEVDNLYWHAAKTHNLKIALKDFPGKVFFAELYGNVKGFKYDCEITQGKLEPRLRFFDVWDAKAMKFLNWDEMIEIVSQAGLQTVPVLYRGPWKGKEQWVLAEGQSALGSNIKEGFIVQPVINRYDLRHGRVKLKLKGEEFSLKKK
jgi:RNA ligase (TIGR02306 family)